MSNDRHARSERLGLLCVVVFIACVLLIWPAVESGVMDDWSYVRTAQILSRTGHIQYNGWATAMLGWYLFPAAAFMRIAGPTFAAARATMLTEASVTIWLLYQCFRLLGLSDRLAALGTLSVALSPIFIVGSIAFMSDVPGLLAVLTCLYCCLRAVDSETDLAASGWIVAAALLNTVLGTARQIAWLGLIAMVPSALFLLRKRHRVLLVGIVCWATCGVISAALLHWFDHQTFSLREPFFRGDPALVFSSELFKLSLRVGFDLLLFSLPVALAFPLRLKRSVAFSFTGLLLLFIWRLRFLIQTWLLPTLLFPIHQTAENTFFSTTMPPVGSAPAGLAIWFRLVVTIVCLLAAYSLLTRITTEGGAALFRSPFGVLATPFLLAYFVFLVPRGIFVHVFDRYLLLPLPLVVAGILLLYQRAFPGELPWRSLAPLALVAIYSIVTSHDFFATYRANFRAAQEIEAAGVPRTEINAGWEYNRYTELLTTGYVRQAGILLPDGTLQRAVSEPLLQSCQAETYGHIPSVKPRFSTAYPDNSCQPTAFPPVPYRTWLPPFTREIVVTKAIPR